MESWPAPAKLNLSLRITGRRPDGYHTLDTVFQFLDFADQIELEVCADGRIERARPIPDVPERLDLTLRAAQALKERCRVRLGVRVGVRKFLPGGGGLGGGSSDAATTLLVLNRLWACDLGLDALSELGLKLGADVPVFVRGVAARATGIGEVLEPANPPEKHYVVVTPPVAVSTAEVFAAWDREYDLTPPPTASRIRGFRADRVANDLEPLVRRNYPPIDNALNWLGEFGPAQLTGSGASVFLAVESAERGAQLVAACPAELGVARTARGLNRNPVHELLKRSS